MKYLIHRVRSWLYWRQFPSPGKTVTEQHEFAKHHLGLK